MRARASADAAAPGTTSSAVTATPSNTTRPERRVRSRFTGTSIDTPVRRAFDQQHIVTGDEQQQVGEAGTQHDTGLPASEAAFDGDIAAQSHARP